MKNAPRTPRSTVRTTTWPLRHQQTFANLAECLRRDGIDAPTVLDVGPGAVSTLLARQLAAGEGDRLSPLANRYRALLRNIDGLIRRLPGVSLHSYEPGELLAVLPKATSLIVTDISPRVVDSVRRDYPHVDTRVFDFATAAFDRLADVVVCLCVLVRTATPQPIFQNLYQSVRPGGLLVIDTRSCTQYASSTTPLESVAPQIWRKPAPQ